MLNAPKRDRLNGGRAACSQSSWVEHDVPARASELPTGLLLDCERRWERVKNPPHWRRDLGIEAVRRSAERLDLRVFRLELDRDHV